MSIDLGSNDSNPSAQQRRFDFAPFDPHPAIRGGHLQTLVGYYLPVANPLLQSQRFEIGLSDGDRLLVFENAPTLCPPNRPVVILVHGLAGSAESDYQIRFTHRLLDLGIRVLRLNLRNAGEGLGLARGIYHAGRSDDLRALCEWTAVRFPDAPIGLVGLSLGGNIVLKLAGEASKIPVPNLDCVLAANPPIDLEHCCSHMQRFPFLLYDRFFVRQLVKHVQELHQLFPDLGPLQLSTVRSLLEFDERYTAPRSGFRGAIEYYRNASARRWISEIQIPGLVIHAEDDPFIPPDPFDPTIFPANLRLELVPSGGHLGYLSRSRRGRDRRWLDATFTTWLGSHWSDRIESPNPPRPIPNVRSTLVFTPDSSLPQ